MLPYRLGIWGVGLYSGNGKADQDGTGGEYDEGAKHLLPPLNMSHLQILVLS
jgi:hypothetical protein